MTREEMIARAKEAVELHKAAYYKEGDYIKADFWDYAEIFEIIDDLYEVTGDTSYFAQMEEMYNFFIKKNGEDWYENPFNDDIMWMVIALTRAYLYTGEKKYLDTAKFNYDKTYARAKDDVLGGGLYWRVENETKNTCVNCPAAVAADYLAKATGDDSYYEKLFCCLDWEIKYMFEPENGKVYDAYNLKGRISKWSSTYNQGTFIGSCLAYYLKTGEKIYLDYAEKAAYYTMNVMYEGGIMNNEEPGNDLPGFKGILARYIRRYAELADRPVYLEWLRKNADSAWTNRNSKGIMRTQLAEKTEESDDQDVFAVSAAVSVVVNAVGGMEVKI